MLGKLRDEHTNYIGRDEAEDFRRDVTSEFGGIGIQIGLDGEQNLTVVSPLPGTPAYRAGLIAGDKIIAIEGEPTRDFPADRAGKLGRAVSILKGKPGTKVSMTVKHVDQDEPETVSLTREVIHIETVLGYERQDGDRWQFMIDEELRIGYVRISSFSNSTVADVRKALTELRAGGMRGLVLDLRFNPGGLFSSAVGISDMFLSSGVIVTTDGRNTPKESWQASDDDDDFQGFPMVVLVNRYSASGSEIVAASLQDNKRAEVMGERTFGKGSVQQVLDLEGGKSILKLTTGSYHRPNGKNIHRFPNSTEADDWGVMPDKGSEIRLTEFELADLFRYDQRRRLIRPGKQEENDEQPTDRHLQQALKHIREQLSGSSSSTSKAG